jgi:hypothetical protein
VSRNLASREVASCKSGLVMLSLECSFSVQTKYSQEGGQDGAWGGFVLTLRVRGGAGLSLQLGGHF